MQSWQWYVKRFNLIMFSLSESSNFWNSTQSLRLDKTIFVNHSYWQKGTLSQQSNTKVGWHHRDTSWSTSWNLLTSLEVQKITPPLTQNWFAFGAVVMLRTGNQSHSPQPEVKLPLASNYLCRDLPPTEHGLSVLLVLGRQFGCVPTTKEEVLVGLQAVHNRTSYVPYT